MLHQLFNIIASIILFQKVVSYSVTVTTNSRQCFINIAESTSSISGSFEVITGEPNQVIVMVTGPPPLHFLHYESKFKSGPDADKDLSEGEFSFPANKEGEYQMCISSNEEQGSDGLPAIVAFNFRTLNTLENTYEYKGLDIEMMELQQGLSRLKDHEAFMNQREDIHKETLESINVKVIFWTIVEAVILIGMAMWQISYISNFFEVKRKL